MKPQTVTVQFTPAQANVALAALRTVQVKDDDVANLALAQARLEIARALQAAQDALHADATQAQA